MTAAYGLETDVMFAGEQQDLVPWLSAADLFLLPSSQESFGLAALEAMACEVPVIASNVGGLPEIITHGVTGFIFSPDAPEEMAECGTALLRDPVRHRAIAQAAADLVRTSYCTERLVPLYEAAYRSLVPTP
jgi:glycosyltransferase involved in cell wall biosynthesis